MKPRKHISQMNANEVAFLVGFVRGNTGRLDGTPHFYDRASGRTFTFAQAEEAIAAGVLIEVNKDGQDVRALFRRTKGENSGTCAVVSLLTFRIITVYYNAPDDNHSTLGRDQFRWRVDVVELVKRIRAKQPLFLAGTEVLLTRAVPRTILAS